MWSSVVRNLLPESAFLTPLAIVPNPFLGSFNGFVPFSSRGKRSEWDSRLKHHLTISGHHKPIQKRCKNLHRTLLKRVVCSLIL